MESLNLITVDELKKGEVFYFENKEEKSLAEISWSELDQRYFVWVENSTGHIGVEPYLNLIDAKTFLKEQIKIHDLQLTYKNDKMKNEIDFTKLQKELVHGDRSKILRIIIKRDEKITNTEVGEIIAYNNVGHPKAKMVWEIANEIIKNRKK